jgi:hypothetical protein
VCPHTFGSGKAAHSGSTADHQTAEIRGEHHVDTQK